ncbi:MAG: HAD family hydrolase [bacterium]
MVSRIVFDLDDTLLESGKYYRRQLRQFGEKVLQQFEPIDDVETVLQRQQVVDREVMGELGLDKSRFLRSLARTWKWYCKKYDREVSDDDLDECLSIGWGVYDTIPEPIDGMEDTLERLDDEYDLVLYTMGDPEIQVPKIRHHSLERWFSHLHIVPEKNRRYLEQVTVPYGVGHTAIIGDSLRGEIQPAIELGLLAIHRETEQSWYFHHAEIDEEFPSIQKLPELFEYLP